MQLTLEFQGLPTRPCRTILQEGREVKVYERLPLRDVLYVVLGIGVMRETADYRLRDLGLAPVSIYPLCDLCAKPESPELGSVVTEPDCRWGYHEACFQEALVVAPATASLGRFTRWMTPSAFSAWFFKARGVMPEIALLLHPMQRDTRKNDLQLVWDEHVLESSNGDDELGW